MTSNVQWVARRLVGIAAFGLAAAFCSTAVAAGVRGIDDYPDRDSTLSGLSTRGFAYRNCTDFAAWRVGITWSSFIGPGGNGNAVGWFAAAKAHHVTRSHTPIVGAVAWWGPSRQYGTVGHVAVVTRVNGNGTVRVEEYNYRRPLAYDNTRDGVRADWYLYIKVSPGRSPVGKLETVKGLAGNRVQVKGWAYDPDRPARPVALEAWIDGRRGQAGARKVSLGFATDSRPDVARVHPEAGASHGYSEVIAGVAPGPHAVRVYALNRFAGGDVTYLGGKTVKVPAPVALAPADPTNPVDDTDPLDPPDPGDTTDPGTSGAPPVSYQQGSYTWASTTNFQSAMGDFNHDGQVDLGLRRISDGTFYWKLGPGFDQGSYPGWATGTNFDAFIGDFNGDSQVDVGLRRISDGTFYWRFGPAFTQGSVAWSAGAGSGFQSFMGDFNHDGQVDVGLRRITTGTFYVRYGPNFGQTVIPWAEGAGAEYQSFMGDFDGDGQVDVGLRRKSDGAFYWRLGPSFTQTRYAWQPGTQYDSFMGDFNGDHKVDVGLRRTTDGVFYWRTSRP